MNIEKKDTTKKFFNTKKARQAVACAIMFAAGTSAFAEGGSLFKKDGVIFDTKAVDDAIPIMKFMATATIMPRHDATPYDLIDVGERNKLDKMISNYDTNYGKGAFKYIFAETEDIAKAAYSAGVKTSLESVVTTAAKNAGNVQKMRKEANLDLRSR